MIRKTLLFLFLLSNVMLVAQQKITRSIESDAPYVEVRTDGIDNLVIEESDSDTLEMVINDADGLGVIDDFTCTDSRCVLSIKTELKIAHPNTNKINQFQIQAASNVTAVVKIPKNRNVTVFGKIIDIQTKGYQGVLLILIDEGKIQIDKLKGTTDIQLNSGSVHANIDEDHLDLKTRKGKITLNEETQKSPYKIKRKNTDKLVIRSVRANIVLTKT